MKKYWKDSLFSHAELIWLSLIIAIGIFLRWYLLDQRAIHHDESLYGLYGKYYWIDPNRKFYKYNPILHGPVLYTILPWVYKFLGISKFSIRFISAALGSFFIFIPLFFQKYFSKTILFILITYIALSPGFIFWSRYIRHDPLVIAFMIMMLSGFFVPSKYRLPIIIPALSLQLCTKENFFITITILGGYLLYDFLITKIYGRKSLFLKIYSHMQRHYLSLIIGFGIGIFIYIDFYSAGFRYQAGILDGIYRKSLSYWINQHSIERIKGPFSFQLLTLSWYELLFIFATIIHIIHFYFKKSFVYLIPISTSIILAVTCHLYFGPNSLAKYSLWSFLKLKIGLDFYPFFILPAHAITLTTYYLTGKNFRLSFWGYFFFASFFSYSFVGERVPWLALYPLTAGLVFLSLYFKEYNFETFFKKHQIILSIVIAASFTFLLKITLLTNFTNAGQPNELINQVHTSKQFEQKLYLLQGELRRSRKSFFCDKIAIWPTSWLLYGIPGFHHGKKIKAGSEYDFLITPHNDYQEMLKLKDTHYVQSLVFRSWWVPHYKNLSWKNFFIYAFTHQPWNPPGNLKVNFFRKRTLSPLRDQ